MNHLVYEPWVNMGRPQLSIVYNKAIFAGSSSYRWKDLSKVKRDVAWNIQWHNWWIDRDMHRKLYLCPRSGQLIENENKWKFDKHF